MEHESFIWKNRCKCAFSFDAAKDDLMAGNIIGAKIEGSALENSFKIKIKVPITTFIGPIGPIRFTPQELTITQKFGEANFTTGVDQYTLKLHRNLLLTNMKQS